MTGTGDISSNIPGGVPPPPPHLPKRGVPEGEMGQRRVRPRRGVQDRASGLMGKRPQEMQAEATERAFPKKVKKQEAEKPFSEMDVVVQLKAEIARATELCKLEFPQFAEFLQRLANNLQTEAQFTNAFVELSVQAANMDTAGLEEVLPKEKFRVFLLVTYFVESGISGYFNVVDSFIKNFHLSSDEDFGKLRLVLSASNSEEKLDLLKCAAKLASNLPQDRHSELVFRFLQIVSKEQRAQAQEAIVQLIKESSSKEQLEEILKKFETVPKDKILQMLETLAKVFKGSQTDVPWGECFLLISKLPPIPEKTIPKIIALYRGLGTQDQVRMSRAILATSKEKLVDVIHYGEMILREVIVEDDRDLVINQLALLPKKQIAEVARWTCQFSKDKEHFYSYEVTEVIKTIGGLIPAERTNILSSCHPNTEISIIRAVAEVSRRERRDVLKQAAPLFQCVPYNKHAIIKALAAIDRVDREVVVQHLLPLIKGINDGLILANYLDGVAKLSEANKVEGIDALWAKLSTISEERLRSLCFQTLAPIHPSQREQFWSMLQETFQSFIWNRESLVMKVNELPPDRRLSALAEAKPWLLGLVEGAEAGDMVLFFAKASQEAKNYVVSHPQLLRGITLNTSHVVKKIAELPPNQIEEIITPLLPLLSGRSNGVPRSYLIGLMAELPPEQREPMRLHLENLMRASSSNEMLRTIFFSRRDCSLDALTLAMPFILLQTNADSMCRICSSVCDLTREELDRLRGIPREYLAAWIHSLLGRTEKYIKLTVVPEELEKFPELLLERVVTDITGDVTSLKVTYAQQAGFDAGGLGRQFISDLFANLAKKEDFKEIGHSGLYRPKLQCPQATGNRLYYNLGKAMMFCLNASKEYPTGILFDQGFFWALLNMPEPLLNQDFAPKLFNELFALFVKMNEHIESELQAVKYTKKYLEPLPADPEDKKHFLQGIYSVVEDDERVKALNIPADADLEPYLEQLQGALRDYIFENVLRPNLVPLIEIAKGMRDAPFRYKLSWHMLRDLLPSEFSDRLQGVFSTQAIVDKLELDEKIPKEKGEWLKNWIVNTNDENRKRFLFALSGSRALGERGIKVKLAVPETAPFSFSTCFNIVSIPFETIDTEAQFCKTLEDSLKDPTYSAA